MSVFMKRWYSVSGLSNAFIYNDLQVRGSTLFVIWGCGGGRIDPNTNNISFLQLFHGLFMVIYVVVGILLVAPVSMVVPSNKKWKTRFKMTSEIQELVFSLQGVSNKPGSWVDQLKSDLFHAYTSSSEFLETEKKDSLPVRVLWETEPEGDTFNFK